MIEQNNPPLKNEKMAIYPLVKRPTSIANKPRTLKTAKVLDGKSLPIKNPIICIITKNAKYDKCLTSKPEIAFKDNTTPKAI